MQAHEQRQPGERARRHRQLQLAVSFATAGASAAARYVCLDKRVRARWRDELAAEGVRDPERDAVRPPKAGLHGVLAAAPAAVDVSDREFFEHLQSDNGRGEYLEVRRVTKQAEGGHARCRYC